MEDAIAQLEAKGKAASHRLVEDKHELRLLKIQLKSAKIRLALSNGWC